MSQTDAQTDRQVENSMPTTNKVCGGYKNIKNYNGLQLHMMHMIISDYLFVWFDA